MNNIYGWTNNNLVKFPDLLVDNQFVNGNLSISNKSYFNNVDISGNTLLNTLSVSNKIINYGTISVNGVATFSNIMSVAGPLYSTYLSVQSIKTGFVSASSVYSDTMGIFNNIVNTGTIMSSIINTNILSTGDIIGHNIDISNNLNVGNTLSVSGISTLTSLSVNSFSKFNQIDASGTVSLRNTLSVANTSFFNNSISISNSGYINGNLSISGNLYTNYSYIGGYSTYIAMTDPSYTDVSGILQMGVGADITTYGNILQTIINRGTYLSSTGLYSGSLIDTSLNRFNILSTGIYKFSVSLSLSAKSNNVNIDGNALFDVFINGSQYSNSPTNTVFWCRQSLPYVYEEHFNNIHFEYLCRLSNGDFIDVRARQETASNIDFYTIYNGATLELTKIA